MKLLRSLCLSVGMSACAAAAAGASSIADGHWDGAVSRLGSVQPVSFDLRSDANGKITGRFDIPEMGIFEEPVADATLNGTQLSLHFLYGTFTMDVHAGTGDMTGDNQKWNPPVALHLKRALPVRTFREEQLTVRNGKVNLAATLFEPLQIGNAPLIIVIPGSSDRGRAAFEYRGYGPMLAQQGIAALVYDKRGIGASSKTAAKATFQDYASDANAIVEMVRHHPGIDSNRVGLGGASQGGWIAPMAAAKNPHVRFLVLLSGPAVSVEQQELDRVAATMREREATAADAETARKITQAYFDVGAGRAPLSELQSQVAWLDQNKPKWSDVLSGPDPGETLQDAVNDWKRIAYDPAATLRSTHVPILAFFGSNDDLVTAANNAPLMKQLVGSNNPHDKVWVIDGANHALFMGQTLHGTAWHWPDMYWSWDRRAPELLPAIVSWMRDLSR